MFASLQDDLKDSLGALKKPRRVTVTEGASEALVISDGGGYTGAWTPEQVPYLIEPMNLLGARKYEAVCFVGPARTGKTAGLILGWMAHALTNDIGRMMVMHMTEKKAAMLSKLDVDTAIAASEKLRALKSPRAHDDTVGLKIFRHGMAVRFAWPSQSELAATTYRYVALTDYDRFPRTGLGGEIFDTAHKRTETLMSRRKTLVESSPERELEDPNWTPATKHEAPPCGGILGIYNRGDRRRYYWPCPHCNEYFEAAPGLSLFAALPPQDELIETVRSMDIGAMAKKWSNIYCPNCGSEIKQDHKFAMNTAGIWLQDGQTITSDGEVIGEERDTTIASFWLGGVAAAYQTWTSIVTKYLHGLQQFALTNSEQALEATTYTDQAMPYMPRALFEAAEDAHSRRTEAKLERFMVPRETRFLIAAVDVQGGTKARFVVQVHAVGKDLEQWIVDRYEITRGPRGEDVQLDPAGYPEDWDVLTERVIRSTYRIDENRELRVLMTAIDSGGEAGVSANAYAWYRRIKAKGFARSVMLVKGGTSRTESPVTKANARDPRGKPLHDVPLAMISTDHFKDTIASARRRKVPGPGFMHFPDWLRATFFDELSAEIRQKNGKWKQIKARNEALDCWVYVLAACWKLGANKLNWERAPGWAKPLDSNSMVVTHNERRAEKHDQVRRPVLPKRVGALRR